MDRFQHLPLICVLRVQNATLFGMPLGFLEHLRRSNLPTIISTFHVSELWLLTLFPPEIVVPPDVWVKFTKNSCVLFLDSLLDMLLLFVSCFATTNWPQFVVQFIVARTRLLEVDEDDSTLSPVQNSVQNSVQIPVHSPVQSPESRFYTNPESTIQSNRQP